MQLPLFTEKHNWRAPTFLPDIPRGIPVAIDTETNDPELTDRGPAFLRGLGHVAGVGLCWKENNEFKKIYLPFGHMMSEGQLDKGVVIYYLKNQLNDPSRDLIFYNAQYDLGWLTTLGVFPSYRRVYDVQVMAALVHEENHWRGLGGLSRALLGVDKSESVLREAASDYGVHAKEQLWMLPCSVVGVYAEDDPYLTYRCYEILRAKIQEEGTERCLDLETRVTPVLLKMAMRGIRVDLEYANKLNDRWLAEEAQALRALGCTADDLWDPAWISQFFRGLGLVIPTTAKGNDSITKTWVESLTIPEAQPYLRARSIQRVRSVFLESVIIKGSREGRIFPQYVQMASDEGGTRTGRLSCKNPNAQQFPKRSRVFDAKSIRKCLLPEEGCLWSKKDYWSQEPTIQLHYGILAKLAGTERVREAFAKGVKLYTFIEKETNGACNYDQSKGVLLGRSYGMGKAKMADTVHLPEDQCEQVLQAFDSVAPYIKESANLAMQRAEFAGILKGLLDRPGHFKQWEPVRKQTKAEKAEIIAKGGKPDPDFLEYKEACELWGRHHIKRAFVYKAYNKLIQGSGATQTKMALVMIDEALGRPPIIQVHDEIGDSVQNEKEHKLCTEIMQNSVKLAIPVRVDAELSPTWS